MTVYTQETGPDKTERRKALHRGQAWWREHRRKLRRREEQKAERERVREERQRQRAERWTQATVEPPTAEPAKVDPPRPVETPLPLCRAVQAVRSLSPGGPTVAEFQAWPIDLQLTVYWESRSETVRDELAVPLLVELYAAAAAIRAERDDREPDGPTDAELDADFGKAVSR